MKSRRDTFFTFLSISSCSPATLEDRAGAGAGAGAGADAGARAGDGCLLFDLRAGLEAVLGALAAGLVARLDDLLGRGGAGASTFVSCFTGSSLHSFPN